MSVIKIPPPVYKKTTHYTEVDCPLPIFKTKILGSYHNFRFDQNLIHFYNDTEITIQSYQYKTIYFKNLILTSLPAEYILFCAKHVYKLGLSHKIKTFLTNDSQPKITLFNYTKNNVTIAPNHLEIFCYIVLTRFQNQILF